MALPYTTTERTYVVSVQDTTTGDLSVVYITQTSAFEAHQVALKHYTNFKVLSIKVY